MRLHLTFCFLVLVISARPSFGQEATTGKVNPALAKAMQDFVDSGEIAGAITLVADNRHMLHQHVCGEADITAHVPLQEDSIFWIASMSKPVTAACVMMLVDQGKLSLDDPITRHLPEMSDLKTRDGKPVVITIRHLLTHTSGMAELKPGESYTSRNLTEAAARYAHVDVLFEPGSKWQYSQTSINTAARIVEVISGMPFDQFVDQKICQPLGMRDTTFYLSDQPPANNSQSPSQLQRLAKSYRTTDAGFEEAAIIILAGQSPAFRDRMPAGNGGLFSTASDYLRFCQMLLNKGELDGHRILSKEAVKTMRTVATGDLVTGFTSGNGWGIGCCVVREPQGVTKSLAPGTFGHGGAHGTQAWIDPVNNKIYILMVQRANFPNGDASDVRKALHDLGSQIPQD